MGKYQPLSEFLRRQSGDEVRLTFAQIERILGAKLPPKAQHYRAWWSNSASNNVMTHAWLEAGFRSEQVDLKRRELVFRRVPLHPRPAAAEPRRAAVSARHPLYGALKGFVQVAPGVDLTAPACPEWSEMIDDQHPPLA